MVKVGDKIKILSMEGEPQYEDKEGVVTYIDAIGQIHGTWGGCAIIPEKDIFKVINGGETAIEYKYGMRLRGFSIGCQPLNGFLRRENDTTGKYFDVIVYERNLTDREVEQYELDRL